MTLNRSELLQLKQAVLQSKSSKRDWVSLAGSEIAPSLADSMLQLIGEAESRLFCVEVSESEPKQDPKGFWYGCSHCGCTDVEVSAWIYANTNEITPSDPPVDDAWCPQCSDNCSLDEVEFEKPFK